MSAASRAEAKGNEDARRTVSAGPPHRAWVRVGSGKVCALCNELIDGHQVDHGVELMLDGVQQMLHFHSYCYREWVIEAAQSANRFAR